jgi:hypothetical protein
LVAGLRASIQEKNDFIFGDKVIQGIRPFQKALIRERKAVLEELTYKQAKERLLCFVSLPEQVAEVRCYDHVSV